MIIENSDFYYWDACIFLEFFRGKEPVGDLKRQEIQRILFDNANRKNTIFTSVFTNLEVLPTKVTRDDEEAERKYSSMFGSKYFYQVEVSAPILTMARDIRDFYFKEADAKTAKGGQMMDTGDAIHLATAIINNATEFHTRDNNKRKGNVPLLELHSYSPNGRIAGRYDLKIVSPEATQAELFAGMNEPSKVS